MYLKTLQEIYIATPYMIEEGERIQDLTKLLHDKVDIIPLSDPCMSPGRYMAILSFWSIALLTRLG